MCCKFSTNQLIVLFWGYLIIAIEKIAPHPLRHNYMATVDYKLFIWNKWLFNAAMDVII